MELDDTICYCFHVTKRKIMNFIRIHQPRRASQVSECGGAGSGCGWCVSYLKKYFEETQAARKPGEANVSSGSSRAAPADPMKSVDTITPEEYAQHRAAYIRAGHGKPPPGALPLPPAEEPSPPPG